MRPLLRAGTKTQLALRASNWHTPSVRACIRSPRRTQRGRQGARPPPSRTPHSRLRRHPHVLPAVRCLRPAGRASRAAASRKVQPKTSRNTCSGADPGLVDPDNRVSTPEGRTVASYSVHWARFQHTERQPALWVSPFIGSGIRSLSGATGSHRISNPMEESTCARARDPSGIRCETLRWSTGQSASICSCRGGSDPACSRRTPRRTQPRWSNCGQ